MGVEVGIRSLFEAPTVEALNKRLDHGHSVLSDFEVLLPIRSGGNKPPLFCIHDAGGFSWPYSKLMRAIPPGRPIYGLQARMLTQRAIHPRSIDDMAEDYLAVIRTVQPRGPYHLLGWSFGGLVAHAIATKLQALGEQVALLALLDSYLPQSEAIASSQEIAIDPIMHLLDVLRREGLATLQERHYEAIMDTFKNNTRLIGAFVPQRFRGDVLLFVATDSDARPAGGRVGSLCERRNQDLCGPLRARQYDGPRAGGNNRRGSGRRARRPDRTSKE